MRSKSRVIAMTPKFSIVPVFLLHSLLLFGPAHAVPSTSTSTVAASDPIADFQKRVEKMTLKNGMRVLIVERPITPTVSFSMYIRTGGIDDEGGKSGLAHMFEHMLFKGTKTIGTTNYKREEKILAEIDRVQAELDAEERRAAKADPVKLKNLQEKLARLTEDHGKLLVKEEFWKIYERAGGEDVNAATGYDFTNYHISLPANQLNLWMAMEADRIRNPVLREFYKERSVVMEERRLRTDNSPQGKLWEVFLAAAFMAHPYGRPIVGWEDDISRVTRADGEAFFKAHYDISRLVLAIVGGINKEEVEAQVRKYFESIPSNPAADGHHITEEPPQEGERRVQVEFNSEPSLLIGYHRPDLTHPDELVFEVIGEIMSAGRTSRLNRNIVEKGRIAVSAWASASTPGERDPHLFAFGGTPLAPHTAEELEKAIYAEIDKLRKEGPTQKELERVKNQLQSSIIRSLSSNAGLANQLAYDEAVTGDWRRVFRRLDQIQAVTADDVKRVMERYFVASNRTVGILVKKKGKKE